MTSHSYCVRLTFLIGCLWGASAAVAQPRPQQVASLNLCTDQLLLALADRAQIASLSRLARDPPVSFLAGQAEGLP
jgi:iron complex transport system substrate-binding protein